MGVYIRAREVANRHRAVLTEVQRLANKKAAASPVWVFSKNLFDLVEHKVERGAILPGGGSVVWCASGIAVACLVCASGTVCC